MPALSHIDAACVIIDVGYAGTNLGHVGL